VGTPVIPAGLGLSSGPGAAGAAMATSTVHTACVLVAFPWTLRPAGATARHREATSPGRLAEAEGRGEGDAVSQQCQLGPQNSSHQARGDNVPRSPQNRESWKGQMAPVICVRHGWGRHPGQWRPRAAGWRPRGPRVLQRPHIREDLISFSCRPRCAAISCFQRFYENVSGSRRRAWNTEEPGPGDLGTPRHGRCFPAPPAA
jgi:hypothetical protein